MPLLLGLITQSGLPRRNYCLLNSRLESVPVSCRTRILLPRHGPPTGGGRHSPDPACSPRDPVRRYCSPVQEVIAEPDLSEVYETGLSRKHRLGSFLETLGFRGKHPSFLRANNFLSGPLSKENTKVKFSLLGRKVCFTQPVSQAPGFGQTCSL